MNEGSFLRGIEEWVRPSEAAIPRKGSSLQKWPLWFKYPLYTGSSLVVGTPCIGTEALWHHHIEIFLLLGK
jgi:hypothetical protein